MTKTTVSSQLKKVLDAHLPFNSSSARAIQRVAALYLGHETRGGLILADALRASCEQLKLFDIEAGAGASGAYKGQSTFAANFTQNMKKDDWLFESATDGWKLTTVGRAEAKRIFEKGEAPAKRRPSSGAKAKPKAKASKAKSKATKAKPKKASAKPKAAAKAKKTTKPKASTSTTKKKAAKRRKKRELAKPVEADAGASVEAEAGTTAPVASN